MYYVQNGDGTRYGPVPGDTIVQWYNEGRIAETARFIDAVTEQPVEREKVLPPMAPPPVYGASPQPPIAYGGAGQAQGYQSVPVQPRLNDVPPNYTPPGYAPQPHLTGATGVYGQGNSQHNPVTACLLCLLCVTAGYIYNKQAMKGVVITLATLGLGLLTGGIAGWFVLAFTMTDCYKIGQRIKAGETVGDWQFF